MGYQKTVTKKLTGVADVWTPAENGGDSRNVLLHLDEWVVSRKPRVLHLNCGLHDLKRDKTTARYQVPIDAYRTNLDQILKRVASLTRTKVIFAATTPVNYEWHHAHKDFDRLEEDVVRYNQVAAELAHKHGAAMNDLFKVMADAGRNKYLNPDGVHFNAEGYTILASAVATAIQTALKT